MSGFAAPVLGGAVGRRAARVLELDALRGLAALVVVIHHVFVIFNGQVTTHVTGTAFAVLDALQAQNSNAVLLFFVLSGYAIGLATMARPPVDGPSLRQYLGRRLGRILPLYYLSLAFTALCGLIYGIVRPSFSTGTLLGNAAFLQTSATAKGNWFVPYGSNGPYWSLSYEMFFYLILPVALWLVSQRSQPRVWLIALGIAATLTGFVMNQVLPSPFSMFMTAWIVWLLGYVAVGLMPGVASVGLIAAPGIVMLAMTAGFGVLGMASDTLDRVRDGTLIGFVFALVALYPGWMQRAPMRALRRVFVAAFLRTGTGSYALYLLHYPLLLAMAALLADVPFGTWPWTFAAVGFLVFTVWLCPALETALTRLVRRRGIGHVPA